MKFLLDRAGGHCLFALALGHDVVRLREILPATSGDDEVLNFARAQDCVVILCNRDDFLALAAQAEHPGIIVLVRRRSRAMERAALVHLLDSAGEVGIRGNINLHDCSPAAEHGDKVLALYGEE